MDFSKFKIPTHRKTWTFECSSCGERADFSVDLRRHGMTEHTRKQSVGARCGGEWLFVIYSEEPIG